MQDLHDRWSLICLPFVAVAAHRLEVLESVRAALHARPDVIDGQLPIPAAAHAAMPVTGVDRGALGG